MIKVSIIVPVYNSDRYLAECIDSLINQTYRNIEIILVNDGSTDDSGKICEEYADKDKRIIVKHSSNYGVSHARNMGIVNATGDYIMFVDSDDYIDNRFVDKMVGPLTDDMYDLILCRCNYVDLDGHMREVLSELDKCSYCLKNDYWLLLDFIGGPVMKLYKLDIIKENELYFDEKVSYSEDRIFNTDFYRYVSKYYFVNDALYFVVNRNLNSLSKQLHLKNFLDAAKEIEFTSNFLIENKFHNIEIINNNRVIDVISVFANSSDYSYIKYKDIVKRLIRLISVKRDGLKFKRKAILCLLSNSIIMPVYFLYRNRVLFKPYDVLEKICRYLTKC